MHALLIALLAGVAMLATDVIAEIMTVAMAKGRGWLAGILDGVGWPIGLITTFLSLNALHSHSLGDKALVIGFVTVANVLGNKAGQLVSSRYVRDKSIEQRLAALEGMQSRGTA